MAPEAQRPMWARTVRRQVSGLRLPWMGLVAYFAAHYSCAAAQTVTTKAGQKKTCYSEAGFPVG